MSDTERLLLRGCAPGQHAFMGVPSARPLIRICQGCQRVEDADGRGCMVCELRGIAPAHLERDDGLAADGWLCQRCLDAFVTAAPATLAGWHAIATFANDQTA